MTPLSTPSQFTSVAAAGAVYDHGAHVVEWTPTGLEPVLWMSTASVFDSASPIRGGVPICLPWFGGGSSGVLKPAHGPARISAWERQPSTNDCDAAYRLELTPSDAFPHTLLAEYRVAFADELALELSVTNTGADAFAFEEALHTYLAVADIRAITVSGLDGSTYRDKAPGASSNLVSQKGDITFVGETDRVYNSTADVTIIDPILKRRLTVSKTNSANTVVWNPWIAKAAAMVDFGNDEWTGMLCVEGANVLADAVTLQPGERHTMGYRLSVDKLA
jgi:glucose-6-phosphate 1-epimerase